MLHCPCPCELASPWLRLLFWFVPVPHQFKSGIVFSKTKICGVLPKLSIGPWCRVAALKVNCRLTGGTIQAHAPFDCVSSCALWSHTGAPCATTNTTNL